MTNEAINSKIINIELVEAQIKELKALVDASKKEIQDELDDRKVTMIDTGMYHIFWDVYEKSQLNTKKLKAEDPDLYQKYSEKKVNTMFKITPVVND